MAKREKKYIKIVYSCLTGKAVWVYQGPTENPRMAYWRACQQEIERFKHWDEWVAERKAWVMNLLNACLAKQPMMSELPEEKRKAAKRLLAIANEPQPFQSDFYDHIMEMKRRREEDRKIRQQMRERAEKEKQEKEQREKTKK